MSPALKHLQSKWFLILLLKITMHHALELYHNVQEAETKMHAVLTWKLIHLLETLDLLCTNDLQRCRHGCTVWRGREQRLPFYLARVLGLESLPMQFYIRALRFSPSPCPLEKTVNLMDKASFKTSSELWFLLMCTVPVSMSNLMAFVFP